MSHEHDSAEESGSLEEFRKYRERMNAEILGENNLVVNRFFALDTRTYEAGALDVKTKELLGLVASLVLRCDDCVTYHLTRCADSSIRGVGACAVTSAHGPDKCSRQSQRQTCLLARLVHSLPGLLPQQET